MAHTFLKFLNSLCTRHSVEREDIQIYYLRCKLYMTYTLCDITLDKSEKLLNSEIFRKRLRIEANTDVEKPIVISDE